MPSVNEIRKTFLEFFKKKSHKIISSSSLVPKNDPTLMFTNSGMVQFKNVFTGLERRDYNKATTSQKCVRAGGKHNDLDNVGYTTRHHTFFEMLGNFSFGDYFKDNAIEYAWELITKDFGIPKDRLLVTVYSEDDYAYDLWKKIAGLPESKIIRISTSDNFWSMGDTGPCGPCSEIFYDHGDKIFGGPPGSKDEAGDRFVEIWNLVFMQFEKHDDGSQSELPKPSIDTGMGLERIAALLQGSSDNYETDLFKTLIANSCELSKTKAEGEFKASHRVIADHLRSCAFLIADGVLPSNDGRGYVLRRIMRRAMRHVELIGMKQPLMHQLVPCLVNEMGEEYGELKRAESLIQETLENEEVRFRQTLDRGLMLLNDEIKELKKGEVLSGKVAFKLYDTYGFPLDLTEDALRNKGLSVDNAEFDKVMEQHKNEARKNWTGIGEAQEEKIYFSLFDKVGSSDYLGYEAIKAEGKIVALVADGNESDEISSTNHDKVAIICNRTPFYGESGGQVGDKGIISNASGLKVEIYDTQKLIDNMIVHFGEIIAGSCKLNDKVTLELDIKRRNKISANHSATHILHKALRMVLGDNVTQKGSLVDDEKLRFDFSYNKPLSEDDIARIEDIANEIVVQNAEVSVKYLEIDEAMKSGAMALFGEKYGDVVRVVSMGFDDEPQRGRKVREPKPYSVELCGGVHVKRLGDIGMIKIIHEGSVGSGVRRIEALTGIRAKQYLDESYNNLRYIADILKVIPSEAKVRVSQLINEKKTLEKELSNAKRELALSGGAEGGSAGSKLDDVEEISGVKAILKVVKGVGISDLRSIIDQSKAKLKSGIVALVNVSDDGKANLTVGVTKDLSTKYDAVKLVKAGSEMVGGKGGGGRADMAQAGGPDGAKADEAISAIRNMIKELGKG